MIALLCTLALAQDYYPLGEGYTWTYDAKRGEKTEEVVKRISKKEKVGDLECFVVEDRGMGGHFRTLYLRPEKDGLWVQKMRKDIEKPWPLLKFPIKKGDTWVHELHVTDGGDSATIEMTVEDEEEVTVPAGKYKAWRVRMKGKEEKENGAEILLTMWFAADVGEVKRTVKMTKGDRVEEGSAELKKFEKGKSP
jgi:hypothetical protein